MSNIDSDTLDDFGCLTAQNYTWCENQAKCLKLLEENCVNGTVEDGNVLGGDEDVHGCVGSEGYTWCEELENCIFWDQECVLEAGSSGNDTSVIEATSSDDTLSYIFNKDVFADPDNSLYWILAACSILCMSLPLCYLCLNKICGWHKKRCNRLQLIVDNARSNFEENSYVCEESLSVNV